MANPLLPEASHWEVAFEHYLWDRLEEAYESIREFGVGEAGTFLPYYRLIEAELLTRRRSVVVPVRSWLTLEYVPDEMPDMERIVAERVVFACDDIAKKLDWQHGVETRIAILAEETDAPWATYPYGYCSPKEPYDKICLPNYLVDDEDEFIGAVAHEYAHVISANLSDGQAPRWLEEAVSVLAERAVDEIVTQEFLNGTAMWRTPYDLEQIFESRGGEDAEKEEVLRAYQQAGWIGRYLSECGTERGLTKLLREHANEDLFRNLRLKISGKDRVDGAMRAVYRKDVKTVFTEAREFMLSQAKNLYLS